MSPFKTLIDWSQQNFSRLPWRRKRTLYRTWVSEIMLQQTTVATVTSRFASFLAQFPDINALATAKEEEVLSAWRGLGYYRRAVNLHKGARYLLSEYKGNFPREESALKNIPGIGEYTAAALTGIGRNRPALPLDANLKRVLARYYAIESGNPKRELQQRFEEGELPHAMETLGARNLIEALMDLGRTLCQATRVQCEECPLSSDCLAHQKKSPLSYGHPQKSSSPPLSLELLRVVVQQKKGVLAYPKKKGEWLTGQWELPTFILHSEDSALSQYPTVKQKISLKDLPGIPSRITRYRIQNHILTCNLKQFRKHFPEGRPWQFYHPDSRPCLLSSTTLKILDLARRDNSL